MMESSKENNKALTTLNHKLLEIRNDRGIKASYLLSHLSKFTNLENTIQLKLVKDSNSNWVNDLLIHNTIPVALYDNLLKFCDTNEEFKLHGDLFEMITNKNYHVDLANLQDKKLLYEFAKKMDFDKNAPFNKSTRDRSLISLLKSPGSMISASGISNTIILSTNPDELCNQLKMLLHEKQTGNNSNIINEKIVAIIDKL